MFYLVCSLHGGAGGHEHINWKCPDWKSYTLDHPELQKYVKELAQKGLKDPWIRWDRRSSVMFVYLFIS